MTFDLEQARTWIQSVDLAGVRRPIAAQGPAADAATVFTEAKAQAQIVGSGLFSFAGGVPTDVREAVAASALLAQLVANKRAKQMQDPKRWFNEYAAVLQNTGWLTQEAGWSVSSASGTTAEIHEEVLQMLTAVLGPAPGALAIVTEAITMLKNMSPDTPWLTLFNQESEHGSLARFQVGLVEADEVKGIAVTLLACLVKAEAKVTQVLVFKFKQNHASFEANNIKASIDKTGLIDLLPAIRNKTRAFQQGYVSSIKDLELT